MPETVAGAARGLEQGATHKLGPLPLWAWVLVLGGVGIGAYWLVLRPASGSRASALAPIGGVAPDFGGGGGGGAATPSTVVATPPALAGGAWLEAAVKAVTAATGQSSGRVRLYLQEYLSGRQPLGANVAQNAFERTVAAAIQYVGLPATVPTSSRDSYYGSNQDYLHDLLAYLPEGTSGAIQNELIALFNGTTDTLSQTAADALSATRDVIGVEPRLLTFTVIPPPPPAPAIPVAPTTPAAPAAPVVPAAPPPAAQPPQTPSPIEGIVSTIVTGLFGSGGTTWNVATNGASSGGLRPVTISIGQGAPGPYFGSIPPAPIAGFVDQFGNIIDQTGKALGNTGGALKAA